MVAFLGLCVAVVFPLNARAQAPLGNEKYDQKQYAEAINAYEKVPNAQRDASLYNRLAVSYHLSNQLRAAERLGITRSSLRHKLRALGITVERAVWSEDSTAD